MYIKITSVSEPQWFDSDKTAVLCVITNEIYGDEKLPFLATGTDPELHGRELFADLVAGKHGPIAEFVPAAVPEKTQPTPANAEPMKVTVL